MAATGFYTFHHDSGHGWLEVPLNTCKGLDISTYSYTDGAAAYLEEDCDAPLWVRHYGIISPQIRSVYHKNECFVRGLPAYSQMGVV